VATDGRRLRHRRADVDAAIAAGRTVQQLAALELANVARIA
jgi:hypothetical protein